MATFLAIFWQFFGNFEKCNFKVKLLWLLFVHLLGENWCTFYANIWSH